MLNLIRRYPLAACTIAFIIVYGVIMRGAHWLVYDRGLNWLEWFAIMAGIIALALWLDRKSPEPPAQPSKDAQ